MKIYFGDSSDSQYHLHNKTENDNMRISYKMLREDSGKLEEIL